ncbi:hypothetical protein CCHR01_01381 [Colletotrichum chrysophilum]|uniref:Uncharacterized protein n=1 Tax=Colletotrichum chrysophilum TaxID=1836956 RepID=A0AAD9AZE4_9PEZI|nr:hypothetical protein CCHR01_01381 [Colletotrichum chrysophilum]
MSRQHQSRIGVPPSARRRYRCRNHPPTPPQPGSNRPQLRAVIPRRSSPHRRHATDAPQIEAGKGASAGRAPIDRHQQHHSASRLAIVEPHGKDLSSNRLSAVNANQRICHRILLLAFALPLEHTLRTHTV